MKQSILAQLVDLLEDGEALYADIKRRCKAVKKSVRQLCKASKVSESTLWRIRKGSKPQPDTLTKLQNTLREWEKG